MKKIFLCNFGLFVSCPIDLKLIRICKKGFSDLPLNKNQRNYPNEFSESGDICRSKWTFGSSFSFEMFSSLHKKGTSFASRSTKKITLVNCNIYSYRTQYNVTAGQQVVNRTLGQWLAVNNIIGPKSTKLRVRVDTSINAAQKMTKTIYRI